MARNFWGSVSTSGIEKCGPICVMSPLHEREDSFALIKHGFHPWYLDYRDIDVPSSGVARSTPRSALDHFLVRQGERWEIDRETFSLDNPTLEEIAKLNSALGDYLDNDSSSTGALKIMVSGFLRSIIGMPITPNQEVITSLEDSVTRISSLASSLRLYDENAAAVFRLFSELKDLESLFHDRQAAIEKAIGASSPEASRAAVLCRSKTIAARCMSLSAFSELLSGVTWLTLEELRAGAVRYDRVIVPGWVDTMVMRELNNCALARSVFYILYEFERGWLRSLVGAAERWQGHLSQMTAGDYSAAIERQTRSWRGKAGILWLRRPALPEEKIGADLPAEDIVEESLKESPDVDYLESRIIEEIRKRAVTHAGVGRVASGKLFTFEDIGAYAYLPPHGRVIELSTLSSDQGSLSGQDEEKKEVKNAERILFRKVSSLTPGSLLAFSVESDRDLIDARADQFLVDTNAVRRTAGMWKTALEKFMGGGSDKIELFLQRLADAGEKRELSTVMSWVLGSNTIAPRNYRSVVPLIAKVTQDEELLRSLEKVLSDVDLIYRARTEAAAEIVKEIFSGDIDLNAEILEFNVSGNMLRYELHRVKSVEGQSLVPIELVGSVHRIDEGLHAKQFSLEDLL